MITVRVPPNLTEQAFYTDQHGSILVIDGGYKRGSVSLELTDWLDWLAIKCLGTACLCALFSHTKWGLQMEDDP